MGVKFSVAVCCVHRRGGELVIQCTCVGAASSVIIRAKTTVDQLSLGKVRNGGLHGNDGEPTVNRGDNRRWFTLASGKNREASHSHK